MTGSLLLVAGGLVLLAPGGELLVRGAVSMTARLGISPLLAGLTIVGFGTSTPELVACIVAVICKHEDVAPGNIVGSNICNILGILGITAAIKPIAVPPDIAAFDNWVMPGTTALLIAQLRSGWRLSRIEGAVLVALYAGYTVFLGLR